MNACAQRRTIVIDQYNVVIVVFGNFRALLLFESHQDTFLLLALNGNQYTVTNLRSVCCKRECILVDFLQP